MAGGLEIINPVASPLLERITKEERVGRELPRRPRDGKPARHKEEHDAETEDQAGESMSSTHIDLRI